VRARRGVEATDCASGTHAVRRRGADSRQERGVRRSTRGRLRNLAGDTVVLCQHADLDYRQHVIALLAGARDGELRARPSFWQLLHTRNALATGERMQLVCHEDVLVFRKPTQSNEKR